MPNLSHLRRFQAGEIAPELGAGSTEPALATCRNFLITKSGGADNRAGTQFTREVKDSTKRTRLIPFIFGASDSYLVEMGESYFRFLRENAIVTVDSVVSPWSNAETYVAGDVVSRLGVNYYCILGHINQQPPNGTYWYALSSNILEVPHSYTAAQVAVIRFDQSGDVIDLYHPSVAPKSLSRSASPVLRWVLSTKSFAPRIQAPTSPSATEGVAGTTDWNYQVTAVADKTYEESLPTTTFDCTGGQPTKENPNQLTWASVSDVYWGAAANAIEYNVYREITPGGAFGLIGVAKTTTFDDPGLEPDESQTPPLSRNPYSLVGAPRTGTHCQQRQFVAGATTDPETVFASRTGHYSNFTTSSPIQDDDAITFRLAGNQVQQVEHLIEADGRLAMLTDGGIWFPQGDDAGVLTPAAIYPKQRSSFGSYATPPVVVHDSLIYVQFGGNTLRDMRWNAEAEGFTGRDLMRIASHLTKGRSIERLAFAAVPDSIVWALRDDGVLLGLTYLPELEAFGWHRHDTVNGAIEDIAVIPETTPPPPGSATRGKVEHVLYLVVNRTINGSTKRYIERMSSRNIEDYRLDATLLDSFLSYNGANAGATTVTLSTAGGWTEADLITVTASGATFSAGDVGNGITVWVQGGAVARIRVTQYISDTVVKGNPIDDVDETLQGVATTNWSRAVDEVSGLSHLEGEDVVVLANGVVLAATVSAGAIALDDVYDVIHVGLPITADFETLDLDVAPDPGLRDRQKLVKSVSVLVKRSRGIMAGPDAKHLHEFHPIAGQALGLDVFTPASGVLRTEILELDVNATWEKPGRVFIRQTAPLPLSILGVLPFGEVGN